MNPTLEAIAGILGIIGLIGLCAAHPESFTPLTYGGSVSAILAAMAGSVAAKAYQHSVQNETNAKDLTQQGS